MLAISYQINIKGLKEKQSMPSFFKYHLVSTNTIYIHNSKIYFRKLNRNNLKCVLGCTKNEHQVDVFTQCQPLNDRLNICNAVDYSNKSGSWPQQIELIKLLYQIDQLRNHIVKKHLLPGGQDCQDPFTLDVKLNSAAETCN